MITFDMAVITAFYHETCIAACDKTRLGAQRVWVRGYSVLHQLQQHAGFAKIKWSAETSKAKWLLSTIIPLACCCWKRYRRKYSSCSFNTNTLNTLSWPADAWIKRKCANILTQSPSGQRARTMSRPHGENFSIQIASWVKEIKSNWRAVLSIAYIPCATHARSAPAQDALMPLGSFPLHSSVPSRWYYE